MTKIQEAIQHLNGEIAKLTVARDALVQIEPAPAPDPNRWFPPLNTAKAKPSKPVKKPAGTAVTAAPVKPIKDLAAPVQATEAGRLVRYAGDKTDKPNTMGGAMKYVSAQLGKTVTRKELKAAIEADADWAKIHENSPTAFASNLLYWSAKNKLNEKADGSYDVVDMSF